MPTVESAYEHCRRIARESGSSFYAGMRLLPPELWREPHHHGFGDNQPAADIEIFGHPCLVHDQAI